MEEFLVFNYKVGDKIKLLKGTGFTHGTDIRHTKSFNNNETLEIRSVDEYGNITTKNAPGWWIGPKDFKLIKKPTILIL